MRRVKQALEHVPTLPDWLGTDVFANEKRTRLMILSRWDSKDSWGSSLWDDQIGRNLADFFGLSRGHEFELYFKVAP